MSSDSARPPLHLPARYLAIVQDILRRYLPHAEVWAYGSRVNGDHYDASDLDLVVRQPDDLTRRQPDLDEVAAAFSDSDLPILVQIVDWARIPEAFREEIEAGYVVMQPANCAAAAPMDGDTNASSHSDWLPNSTWKPGSRSLGLGLACGSEATRQNSANRFFFLSTVWAQGRIGQAPG